MKETIIQMTAWYYHCSVACFA